MIPHKTTAIGARQARGATPTGGNLRRVQATPCLVRTGAGQVGRRRVKVVPWPSRLSARSRPWCASTMSRQTDSPRPVPPSPEASGPVLVVKNGSKIRRRSAGAIPTPVSATLSSASRPEASGDAEPDRPPLGHRLAGVDDQVQKHLLDLRGIDAGVGAADRLEVEADPAPREVLAHQQDYLLGQPDQVGRLAAVAAGPGQAEHPTGDRRGPLRRLDDLLEGAAAELGVGVSQAELGVVEDRRQRVVQLVADAAGQNAETADPLQARRADGGGPRSPSPRRPAPAPRVMMKPSSPPDPGPP